MQLVPVTFCGRPAHTLQSDADRSHVVRELEDAYGVRVLDAGPRGGGARRAVALQADKRGGTDGAARVLDAVVRRGAAVVVHPLARGATPGLLYLHRFGHAGICLFVERRVQPGAFFPRMTLLRLFFDDTLFEGTVIDGELAREAGGWTFWAADLLAVGSQRCHDAPLAARLARLATLLARQHFPDDHDVLAVRPKPAWCGRDLPHAVAACRDGRVRALALRADVAWSGGASAAADVVLPLLPPRLPARPTSASASAEEDAAGEEAAQEVSEDDEDDADERGECDERVLFACRTGLPDVYELHDDGARRLGVDGMPKVVAVVPTLACSRMLRARFAGTPSGAAVEVKCRRQDRRRFGAGAGFCWVPTVAGTDAEAKIA